MPFNFIPSNKIAHIKSRLSHPIIDVDGHQNELLPLVVDFAREIAGREVANMLVTYRPPSKSRPTASGEIGRCGVAPLDRLTTSLPRLLHSRLDEIGIDFSITFPSWGLRVIQYPDDEIRQVGARALNTYYPRVYEGFRDRLEPVAVIPTFTPEEACAELRYAVGDLGLKLVVMSGGIVRDGRPDEPGKLWVDTMGHGSLYDYDSVWELCGELGVVPAFHGSGVGWGTRTSRTNLVYNHLGHFATAQEGVCRSLVMGGVPLRFPDLQFLFLEGGVSWACQLYADLLSHFEKLNHRAVQRAVSRYREFDGADGIIAEYVTEVMMPYLKDSAQKVSGSRPSSFTTFVRFVDDETVDEFEESRITCPEEIISIFTQQLNFGCEADDAISELAFDRSTLPYGTRMNAMLGSDIGHWDVSDIRDVLPEAWELVERGHLTEEEFRLFTCDNVTRMVTSMNPEFFMNTVVEGVSRVDEQAE